MDLSRRLCSTALVAFIVLAGIHDSQSRFPGLRQKRQYGANMYLPESSVTPGGEGDDPNEWSMWSTPSDCSRTCGGGVSYQTRECLRRDDYGEAVCSGGSRRYFSCNTQDCPEEEPDFRAQQCSRFDNQKFDGVLHEWVPYTNAPNPCELNCMPKGERFYYRQRETVVDGTRCNDKDLDVCVNGECMPVGCDMMLGSDAKEDKCRKCGGDGSTCKTIRNTINTKDLAPGYNDLLLLPQGATNIRVEETQPSSNYLACRNHSGHFYLNGDWRIDFPRPMFFANSWWNYQRKPMGFAAPDQLTCSGPISESIFVVMLVQERNISLDYEYSIPESLSHSQEDTHTWTHHQFSPCSASCGGGTQSRVVTCNNRITLAEVNPKLCDEKSKPVEEQACGTEPCAPHWVEGEWSKCSKGCGSDGTQNRTVTCERISSSGEHTVEEDAVCLKEVGNKPATVQECNRDVKNCPKYHLGPWTPCDKLCGEGKQTRKVTCFIEENGRKRVLPEEDCVEEKPEVEKTCLLAPCEGVDWIISQWSGCNACGQTTETRTAICGNKEGKVYPEKFCEPEVPTLSRPCKSPKCQAQWFSSEWSKCSAPCGKGVQSRIVICGVFDGKTVTPASDDSQCDQKSKPEAEQDCEGEEKECPGEWFTGPWGKCSKPCGGGERVREVLCLANGTKSVNCDEDKVESLSEKCNPEACTEDEILPLTNTDKPIEDDEEECDEEGIELISDNLPELDKNADIIDFDDTSKTETTPEAEELMQSDSPSTYDSTLTTVEGSGDETDTTTDSGISTEGSGDDEDTSDASTDLSSSTAADSSSSDSSPSDSTSSDTTSSDFTSSDSTSSDSTSSDSSSSSSDATSEAPSSSVSDSSDSTDSSTESTAVSDGSSDASRSTDASSSDSTDVTSSTDSSSSTDASDSTPSGSTESSSSTDASTDSSDKSSDVSESSTEASSSSVSDSSDNTDSTTSGVSSSTESSSDSTSSATSDSTQSSDSTESTSDVTTESTPESSTDTTESSTLDASSTTDASSTSDASSSSESSTENSASSSTSSSEATESTGLSSDASTTDATTVEGSTETSTDGTSDGSTDASTDGSSDSSTDASTDGSSDGSTDSSTEVSSEATDTTLSTDSSGSTESTEAGSSDASTTEGSTVDDQSNSTTSDSTTIDSSSSTDVSGSTEASESTASSEASSTDATESTESTASGETSDTTESGPTEESTSEGSTDSTTEGSTDSTSEVSTDSTTEGSTESSQSTDLDSTTSDIWSTSDKDDDSTSTPYSFESEVTTGKPRKCKPKKSTCAKSEYGCCPDGKSTPTGPFDEGCPIAKTCKDTKYGCCLDGVSPAKGKDHKGCPKSQCAESLFGCCPDNFTPAEGEDDEGCPETTTVPPTTTTEESQPESTTELEGSGDSTTPEASDKSCSYSEFGCCPDAETPAKGENFKGCGTEPEAPKGCAQSEHGCCPDGRTAASGPNGQGCAACTRERFGCCPDSETPAHGPNNEGCCLESAHGCCPDNILAARGPNNEGCDCYYTPFGCCPDNKSPAHGYNQEGCACETTQHGCCPDKITAAKGPKFEGCPCETTQFGCCPDGITFARGPHHHGCHCTQTEFKCCEDEKTPAKGPDGEGCTCVESKFGCCPDGVSKATDEKFGGCENVQEPPQKACGLPKETGSCSNFSVKYYFDIAYGGCARFWYGGCDGNDNRFESEAECKDTCQDYTGKHVCLLPKSSGPCTVFTKKWYFDVERNRCEEFQYGGCYGTNNRFDSLEECQGTCAASENLPTCEQPVESGPCSGNFERWYYDNQTDVCRPFTYGGCKGNKNNYPTEHACNYNCRQPGVLKAKDICEIPAEVGECANYVSNWYYDTKDQTCRQFYYGGCGGNENRFPTEESCLARCDRKPEPTTTTRAPPPAPSRGDICEEPQAPGECGDWTIKWSFDSKVGGCQQFYYGGCGGNGNRFETESDCLQRCNRRPPPPAVYPPTTVAAPTRQPAPAAPPADQCRQRADPGECDQWELKWSFNATANICQQFYYGGCGGNDNRFESEEDCTAQCDPKIDFRFGVPEPAEPEEPVEEPHPDTSKCFLPSESGNCYNNETRWFYNSQEGLCDEFVYSGCGGNANNYATEEECQSECNDAQTTCALPPVRGRCRELSLRWYFDERTGGCHEFEFTGCRGNRNNFVSERECLSFCRGQAPQPEPQPPAPTNPVCSQPPEAGECDNRTTAWFYDNENMACTAFTYTGCGGNENRFETRDQCERQCGEFKDVDVCNEPATSGPCTDWQTRYYFNKRSQACEPFTYGGCDGTGNRFNDLYECQTVCIAGREPTVNSARDICLQPVVTGRCNGPSVHERRWYYDDSLGNCMSFIYAGCNGNQNNFRSFEACTNQCRPETNDLDNGIGQSPCDTFDAECQELRCPYGVRRVAAQSQPECTQCVCEDPCEGYSCPEGQKCAVDVSSTDDRQFAPLCREVNKPGECPALSANASGCARECYTDADCRGDTKCCNDGCGQLCVHPARPTLPPRTQAPVVVYPGDVRVALEPKRPTELDVHAAIGGIAVLRCFATGNPAPNITWSLRNLVINTNKGRYVLTPNGDLTIVQVRQTDDGTYVCVASNGLGDPVRREVALQVTAAENLPAYIYGDKNVTQIVQLNRPAVIRCPAGGHPKPHVSWWRNGEMFGLKNNLMARDYSLVFNSIQLKDLGLYTCEVYNQRRPVSLRVTLKAVGPVRALTHEDAQYLQYVLAPATRPVTQRPSYPFRPTRPAYVPEPTVNVNAVLALDSKNSYTAGSTIVMNCAVQGYPEPNVTWTKDDVPIYNNQRVQITYQPHRLVVNDVTPEDSGKYTCSASNAYTYASSEANVSIQSVVPVSPECVDNPYFANCKLIVQGKYCFNPYYTKFCCRSCTLAGQIAQPQHPNAV
ncbi:papilin isoform X2 [Drosophila ficusphila]|uniref:papilin isoform X2 n=1 Tax=Drosophila ficusphila TaxID=30025 RepID=UPI0007E8288D|nr:papilin isoform X2 [Drosophila ficusphila]